MAVNVPFAPAYGKGITASPATVSPADVVFRSPGAEVNAHTNIGQTKC
jgi:hypothetical protein